MKRSFRITYNVHCTHINYYDKEIIVRNAEDEWDAKNKLANYCNKKYLGEFISIEIRTVAPELKEEYFAPEANKFMDFFNEMINKKK